MKTPNKHVYFFRHGESVANATKIRQGPQTPLTERGRAQAELLGGRLANLPIERIVSSEYLRAHDTARIVAGHTGHEHILLSPLLVERRNPTAVLERPVDDGETAQVWEDIAKNYGVPGWRHSDEENFEDLILRTKNALRFLLTLPEERIAAASHGLFMKFVLAHVLLGDSLGGRIFWDQFVPAKNVENTGIMHLEYTQNYEGTKMHWKLISWNDHAHLE